jgi:hypothetical protein
MTETITAKLSETYRGKPEGSRHTYRYVTCRCGRKLNIGSAREVEESGTSVAMCASPKCGITVRIVKG